MRPSPLRPPEADARPILRLVNGPSGTFRDSPLFVRGSSPLALLAQRLDVGEIPRTAERALVSNQLFPSEERAIGVPDSARNS